MAIHHNYSLTVKWTGNNGQGTKDYRAYNRDHTVFMDGKNDILCSSDAAFRGDPSKPNPEELLLASISSCHMLWYLHLCADHGIVVVDYSDKATGIMQETETGSGRFIEVTLHPVVVITDKNKIDLANKLHKKANEFCFIANSCNFTIHHLPTCSAQHA
jgi:organic hydroperoxide reductase OsmC/OhrA